MSPARPETPEDGLEWIAPVGGIGDMLMLSGVLKQVFDRDPRRRFNLLRRTNYLAILEGHPAIAHFGFPPRGTDLKRSDYWGLENVGPGSQRPFQILARHYGLETPVEETLYVPPPEEPHFPLLDFIPWKSFNVLIAPASDSPRKMVPPPIWHRLVDLLHADGAFVLQGGRLTETHIRNAYSVLGLTTPRQFISLLRRCSIVVTSDSLAMHAAHYAGVPAVALWGATRHAVYGYPEQVHIQMPRQCGLKEPEDCIAPERNSYGRVYTTACPMNEKHCLDQIRPESILEAVRSLVSRA